MSKTTRLLFPHQLFEEILDASTDTLIVLIEDDLFFTQYKFHKQKLILHRASMQHFADELRRKGFTVEVVETSAQPSMTALQKVIIKHGITSVSYYDLVDDWLQQAIDGLTDILKLTVERLNSPGFLTSPGLIEDYFEHNPNRMQYFYEWQRKRLQILVHDNKPDGGKWSYDTANRKKLPKNVDLPPEYAAEKSEHYAKAKQWVEEHFASNPGSTHTFNYPLTHKQAKAWLQDFINNRLELFGPYEDAISTESGQLFHSVLSSSLNIGLLTPQQVIDAVLDHAKHHKVPIESLEGFIRQIIGWREYMRATYVQYGRKMRGCNYLRFKNNLKSGWWDGSTGIAPIDDTISRVLTTGYAHHIERLMVLGNSMVLLRINPDHVYEWFMSLFIDAYDWVMVPNVYAMSQFAAGDMITTKPYISGSNYIIKMSDYKKTEWAEIWDALYWQFIADYRTVIEQNYRSRMVVNLYDRFDDTKKQHINKVADPWLT